MSADTKLQYRFVFPEKDCFLLLTEILIISEKLDFKIKIPRNAMCCHAVMFPNFSGFFQILNTTTQGTKPEQRAVPHFLKKG